MSKKQQLLDTLLNMVAENGFHEASMRDLSDRSGISIGNIYHYFKGKDELILGLYDGLQEQRVARLLKEASDAGNSEEVVKNTWTALFNYYTGNSNAFRFIEQFSNSPYYTDEVANRDRERYDPLITLLEQGIAKGELRYMHPLSMSYILFGHAAACARLHLEGKVNIKEYQQDVVRQSCWDSLRPMKY